MYKGAVSKYRPSPKYILTYFIIFRYNITGFNVDYIVIPVCIFVMIFIYIKLFSLLSLMYIYNNTNWTAKIKIINAITFQINNLKY